MSHLYACQMGRMLHFCGFGRLICLSDNFLVSRFLLTTTALLLIILIMRDNTVPTQPCNSFSHEFCL